MFALTLAISACDNDLGVAPDPRPVDACKPVPNYSGNASLHDGNGLLRWDRLPVLVALDSPTLSLVEDRTTWEAGILLGAHAWSVASGGAMGTVRFVSDTAAADIVILLATLEMHEDCLFLNCAGVVAVESSGRQLLNARVLLFPEATTWSRDKVAQITAHEMGHALGLLLHSSDVADLMYGLPLPAPAPGHYPWITQSDLNTLTVAYCGP